MMQTTTEVTTAREKKEGFFPARAEAHARGRCEDLRILFLIDRLSEMGGAELALARLVGELPAYGIKPRVITFSEEMCSELSKRFTCPVQPLALRRTYDFGAWRVAREIRSLIRREDIRLVHTFFETSDLFGGLITRSVPGVALVTSRRDMGILRGRKHRIAYPLLAQLSHRVVTVSEKVRTWCITADRLPPERVVTVYNGIESTLPAVDAPSDRQAARNALGVAGTEVIVSAIGHIRHVKGYDVLVDAATVVLKTYPTALFLIAGAEHEAGRQSELEAVIHARGLEKNIRLLGGKQHIPTLLAASDIYLLPSRSEGFSNALIEAMGAGLPCVATDVGGNAEAIHDGVSGHIVPPEDPEAMALALDSLLRCAVLRHSMGKEGRRIAHAHFTHSAMMQNMLSLYRDALCAADRSGNLPGALGGEHARTA